MQASWTITRFGLRTGPKPPIEAVALGRQKIFRDGDGLVRSGVLDGSQTVG